MCRKLPLLDKLGHDRLEMGRRTLHRGTADTTKRIHLFRGRNQITQAKGREERLGKAPYIDDRNAWYAKFARQQIERIEGPLKARLIEVCGAESYEKILQVSYANAGAAACGGLRPTHIRASK